MTISKSRRGGGSSETTTISVSGPEGQNQKYDPALVSLFALSLGAVKTTARSTRRFEGRSVTTSAAEASKSSSDADSEENGLLSETSMEQVHTSHSDIADPKVSILSEGTTKGPSRKRKWKDAEDDLESRYMSQLAREEIREDQNRARTLHNKSQKVDIEGASRADIGAPNENGESTSDPDIVSSGEERSIVGDVPQHESIAMSREDLNLEKSSRTVFLANISTMAIKSKKAKKTLMDHLASFTSSLPTRNGGHKIESLRFRSTAFAASGIPKKAAFVKKEIMDATTRSTNAYAVYTTRLAAREAATRLNGSIVLDRHLRVDSVAHPAKIDHRRCVFVGNLGFVDDETNIKAAEDEENKKRPRIVREIADVEEGLWRQFEKAGVVESVRVVRDKTTRVGKGIAYVQFKDANSVEKALLYHGKIFPPMLPRILRVTRAKNTRNATNHKERPFLRNAESSRYIPKVFSQVQSLTGRAHKLLGRAGAAELKATGGQYRSSSKNVSGVAKSSEPIVFEGFRVSSSQGTETKGTAGRNRSKPSKRSKEFKAKGRKKTKP